MKIKACLLAMMLIICLLGGTFAESAGMQADAIYINGSIYTVNDKYPWATAMVVKDGKFIYVGDDRGALEYSGPVTDLDGQFVMPGIVDSHTHIAWGSQMMLDPPSELLFGTNKAEVLEALKADVTANPDADSYRYIMFFASLAGEKLTRDELDEVCSEKPLLIVETEQHSRWMNSREMAAEHIDEYMPDISAGLSYCERDGDGRINGRMYEFCGLANYYTVFSEQNYEDGLNKLADMWKKWGVVAAFDAGQPTNEASINNFFTMLIHMDKAGELPFYLEGCYYIYNPAQLDNAIAELQRYDETYNTDHVRVRTMKIMMDGTHNGHTAAIFEPYADVDSNGATLFDADTLADFIIKLNAAGIDLHIHTVGERAVATVLDAVESARNILGEEYRIQVTCAHVESIRNEDIGRFAELGVMANFTPAWLGGNCYLSFDQIVGLIGEDRAARTYRANSIWNTGAIMAFSSDSITLSTVTQWSPYVGIETGITRQNSDALDAGADFSGDPILPGLEERLSVAQMIRGYTLNGAKQMNLDDKIGSIEVGKDASFLVFEESLFDVDVYRIHNLLPNQFYIRGELVE